MKSRFTLLMSAVITLFLVLGFGFLGAQDRVVSLQSNPGLWKNQSKSVPRDAKALLYQGYYVINSNTLSLPFVDDFSASKLPTADFPQSFVNDSVRNASGPCLTNTGVQTIQARFMLNPSWQYFYDTLNDVVDSLPKAAVTFNYMDAGVNDCINAAPAAVFTLYPEYYTYTFDTATGIPLDSLLMTDDLINPDTILDYAPVIYYADLDPNWLWMDKFAWINRDFPVFPPTIGVATLDGLNEFGFPYNNRIPNAYGDADFLTSKPIDLSAFAPGDSIYLSFFYEPQGLGDWPNQPDSLVLEFIDDFEQWIEMWSTPGFQRVDSVTLFFQQALIPILSVPLHNFFHNKFQFRFRNKASLTGNNDHWHLDYVRLDRNRFAADTVVTDIAYIQSIPSLLKNFDVMPADQFTGPDDLTDSISIGVRNNEAGTAPATNYNQNAAELYPASSIVFTSTTQAFNASTLNFLELNPASDFTIPVLNNDSMVIRTESFISPGDINARNDTVRRDQIFSNTLAYDDGTAEKAYGLEGLGLKKFAYEFNLNYPDTLVAFQVMFTQINERVDDLIFSFQLWDSLRYNDVNFTDTPLVQLDNKKPFYLDSINGFATYVLDTPLIISDKLYVGWAQTDTRNLQIGYDLNSTKGYSHMYIFTNAVWKRSLVTPEGSPMIRLIFDTDYRGFSSSVKNETTQSALPWNVYPNPAQHWIRIQTSADSRFLQLSAIDLQGRSISLPLVQDQADVSMLNSGVYLLNLTDTQTGWSSRKKLVITNR